MNLLAAITNRLNLAYKQICNRDLVLLAIGSALFWLAFSARSEILLWISWLIWLMVIFSNQKYFVLLVFFLVGALQVSFNHPQVFPDLFAGFKTEIAGRVNQLLPSEHAALFMGMLVGSRESFAPDFKKALTVSGTMHIVAISGANIAIFAEIIKTIFYKFPRKVLQILQMFVIFIFLLVIGVGNIPALRACLSFAYASLATLLGRKADNLSSLGLAALLIMVLIPGSITSVSFQLTFVVSLALVIFAEVLQTKLKFLGDFWAENIALVFIANLATLPIIALVFEQLPIYALPVNLLASLIVEIIFIEAVCFTPIILLLPQIAKLITPLVWLPLEMLIRIVKFAQGLPNAQLDIVDSQQKFIIVIIFAFLIIFLLEIKYRAYQKCLKN